MWRKPPPVVRLEPLTPSMAVGENGTVGRERMWAAEGWQRLTWAPESTRNGMWGVEG